MGGSNGNIPHVLSSTNDDDKSNGPPWTGGGPRITQDSLEVFSLTTARVLRLRTCAELLPAAGAAVDCSESAPTHPNTTVLSVGSITTIPRKLMYKQVSLPRECIGKQIFFAIQYFNCSG
nr:hypothetical protein CFP56_40128 [Quercus suber]